MENEIKKINSTETCIICRSIKISFFTEKNGFKLYKCLDCSLIFVNPLPKSAEAIYSSDYFRGAIKGHGYVNYDEDKEPMVPTFERYLSIVEGYTGGYGNLLDVGTASGFFLNLAKTSGWHVSGVEISDHAASIGRQRGFDIKTGALSEIDFKNQVFDVITMFDVLEHFITPVQELRSAHRLLKSGGLLVINTPDTKSLFARILGKHWHLLVPPEHLFYFSSDNLTKLLEKEGFEVLLTKKIGKSFSLSYIFKMLHVWQGFRFWLILSEFFSKPLWRKIKIPINLRDNMFLIVNKKHDA